MTVFLLNFMAVLLVLMMIIQGISRRVDLLSLRNMFLFGFIVYQLSSPAMALYNDVFPLFQIYTPEATGKKYAFFAFLYLAIFLFSYHRLKFTPWVARKFSGPPREMGDTFLLGLAMFLVCAALMLRLLGPSIPLIRNVSIQTAIALVTVASALASWVWGNRRSNPAVVAMAVFIVAASLGIGLIGAFTRRPLLGILMGFAWGAYHRRFKFMPPTKMMINLLPLVVFAAVAVSAFTAIRDSRKSGTWTPQETMRKMTQANVGAGAQDILSGQTCGAASLWCVENYPHRVEPRLFFTLRLIPMFYVPRALWPDKPMSLAIYLSSIARVEGVARGTITLPPGMIGYAAAEGGLMAIILYGLFFGQFLRFFDSLIQNNPINPILILPCGCVLGQALGLARGDVATFTNLMVLEFVSTYVLILIAGKLFGSRTPQAYYAPWPQTR